MYTHDLYVYVLVYWYIWYLILSHSSVHCLSFSSCVSHSPEPRNGKVSSRSLSPSGAPVARSNRAVPRPESGNRGNKDCKAWEIKSKEEWTKKDVWEQVKERKEKKKRKKPNVEEVFSLLTLLQLMGVTAETLSFLT